MTKKIIHIDMDCFFAAVEMRENPELRDKAVAVGGSQDRRGVIATCNYKAREFGVRSAMATAHALKLCPALVLVPGNMALYKAISAQVRAIFERYTDLIEPLSLDEAYLDVSECTLHGGSATLIAEAIRADIANETGLTASAGVAPNKFIAKIASDENKPNGICVISPDKVSEFVEHLPLYKIPGVGAVTREKLAECGLHTTADIRAYSDELLYQQFGKLAPSLISKSKGIDTRELVTSRIRKSIGVEHTLPADIKTIEAVKEEINRLQPKLLFRIERNNAQAYIHKVVLKLKFSDFKSTTIETTTDSVDEQTLYRLLSASIERWKDREIRLVGLAVGLDHTKNNINTDQLVFDF